MRTRFLTAAVIGFLAAGQVGAKVIYETGFENNGQLPQGWETESHGPGPDWGFGGNGQDWHMRVRYGPGGEQDEWLVSPSFDLSEAQGISVKFWHWFRTAGLGSAQIRVSIDGGQSWETLVEYDLDQAGEPEIAAPQADGQSDVRFCWRYLADFDIQWDVDDVTVYSQVAVDMSLLGTMGPRSHDHIIAGNEQFVKPVFVNLGSETSPETRVVFSTTQGSFDAVLPPGIVHGESLVVMFDLPGWLFSNPGQETLTIVVDADGDLVGSNDSLTVSPLVIDSIFQDPATTTPQPR